MHTGRLASVTYRLLRATPRPKVMIVTGMLCLFVSFCYHWYQVAMKPDNLLIRGLDEHDYHKVRAALIRGADPNRLPNEYESMRPLERAAASQDPDMALLLLDYGANPNLGSGWGVPLDEAISFYAPENPASKARHLQLMKILTQHGAIK